MVTVLLMGLVIVGSLSALATTVKISDQGWRFSQGSVKATNLAESTLAMTYFPCVLHDQGAVGPAAHYQGQLTIPSGVTLTVTGNYLTGVGAPANTAAFGACGSSDLGAQQLTFNLTYTSGGRYVVPPVTVIKRDDRCSTEAQIRGGYIPGQKC